MDLGKIVVVDIEATCWEGKRPADQKSEVVEFGVSILDVNTGVIESTESILVKPTSSQISNFCTQLTTITPEMIEKEGISYKEACKYLQEQYYTKSRVWASYGAYDLNQVQKQCSEEKIAYPFSSSHINVKVLFSIKNKLKGAPGMAGALAMLQIPLEGTHHRGGDDSRNIAKILGKLLEA